MVDSPLPSNMLKAVKTFHTLVLLIRVLALSLCDRMDDMRTLFAIP